MEIIWRNRIALGLGGVLAFFAIDADAQSLESGEWRLLEIAEETARTIPGYDREKAQDTIDRYVALNQRYEELYDSAETFVREQLGEHWQNQDIIKHWKKTGKYREIEYDLIELLNIYTRIKTIEESEEFNLAATYYYPILTRECMNALSGGCSFQKNRQTGRFEEKDRTENSAFYILFIAPIIFKYQETIGELLNGYREEKQKKIEHEKTESEEGETGQPN